MLAARRKDDVKRDVDVVATLSYHDNDLPCSLEDMVGTARPFCDCMFTPCRSVGAKASIACQLMHRERVQDIFRAYAYERR